MPFARLSNMTDPDIAERYDEKMAAAFLSMSNKLTGLPEFLGVRLISFEPVPVWKKRHFSWTS